MNDSLAILDKATKMLAEVRTIDDARDLIDMAEAARVYARQVSLGLEAQNHAAEIKLRAQRRAGEILASMDKAKGAVLNGRDSFGGHKVVPPKETPTYADLSISKNDASNWQKIAALPEKAFEDYIDTSKGKEREITTSGIVKVAKELARPKPEPVIIKSTQSARIIQADFREELLNIAPESIDFIITDPPYPKEYVPLYKELARLSNWVLKPGGSLLVMCGQSYFPEILHDMSQEIAYHWTLAYLTPGGQAVQVFPRKVNVFWKPVIWFVKGEYNGRWIGDVSKSAVNDNDKRFHGWGQSESGMYDLMSRFVKPGDVVLDPFCGGGTTGIAALELGCDFIGIDNDPKAVETAKGRMNV